jgi:hypothetical protein
MMTSWLLKPILIDVDLMITRSDVVGCDLRVTWSGVFGWQTHGQKSMQMLIDVDLIVTSSDVVGGLW